MSEWRGVLMPVAAMLAAQALLSMATVTLPVLAPAAAVEIGAPVAWIGLFVAIIYASSMASGLASGALVRRWGALRLAQLCLLSAGAGVALLSTGQVAGVATGAVLMGMGYGPLNPASSHLLNRVSPPRHLSKIFSLKQTGVPLGGVLAGALLPPLVLWGGWRVAALCVAGACVLLAAALQPLRAGFDVDRTPGTRVGLGSLAEPARVALADRAGRPLALSSFFFAALQLCLGTYLVAYLTAQQGYDLVQAGLTLAVTQGAGIAGRLLSGALADRSGRPRVVMGAMGCTMGACAIASAFAGHWPTPLLLLLYAVFGASAIGWNGVYLALVARLVPQAQAAQATGGTLFFTFSGVLLGAPLFGSLGAALGSLAWAYALLALPLAVVLVMIARADWRP